MEFQDLRKLIEENACCRELLGQPGEIYFGSEMALRQPNGVAVIGLNPGGTGLGSLRKDLDLWESNPKRESFVSYLDVCWHEPAFSSRKTCGRCDAALKNPDVRHVIPDRHQARVIEISEKARFDLRKSLALNAIWIQTATAEDLRKRLAQEGLGTMQAIFEKCFYPVLRELLNGCGTRFVLCLGNGQDGSAFSLLRRAVNVSAENVEQVGPSYRDGRYFEHNGVVYFGVAHPSRHKTSKTGLERIRQLWEQQREDRR